MWCYFERICLALRSCREVCVCLWKASRASHMQGSWTISTFISSHHNQTTNITEIPRKGWFELRVIIDQIIYPPSTKWKFLSKYVTLFNSLCNVVLFWISHNIVRVLHIMSLHRCWISVQLTQHVRNYKTRTDEVSLVTTIYFNEWFLQDHDWVMAAENSALPLQEYINRSNLIIYIYFYFKSNNCIAWWALEMFFKHSNKF